MAVVVVVVVVAVVVVQGASSSPSPSRPPHGSWVVVVVMPRTERTWSLIELETNVKRRFAKLSQSRRRS